MSQIVNPVDGAVAPLAPAKGGATTRSTLNAMSVCGTTAGAVTVQRPSPRTEGSFFAVWDFDGNAATNNITVDGDGDLIDGSATCVISQNGAAAFFLYNSGQWRRLSTRRLVANSGLLVEFVSDDVPIPSPINPTANLETTGDLLIGPTPRAATGTIRMADGSTIKARNVANSADVVMMMLDALDVLQLAPDVAISASLRLGTTPATSGVLRLANLGEVKARNAANSADVTVLQLDAADTLRLAATVKVATALALGAIPATVGHVRLPLNGSIYARNSIDTDDLPLLALAADALCIGTDGAFTDQVDVVNMYASSQVALGLAAATYLYVNGANLESWVPRTGSAVGSKPYGSDGVGAQAMANANQTPAASIYMYGTIKTTGAITANRDLTLPGVATGAEGYYKWIQNTCTGAFSIVVKSSLGGASVTIANGKVACVFIDGAGITRFSPDT